MHRQAREFFADSCPRILSEADAYEIAEHVTECEECSQLMHAHPDHARVMVTAVHNHGDLPSDWSQMTANEVESDQRELHIFAETLVRSLGGKFAQMNRGLSKESEKWLELASLRVLPPLTYQLALVAAESSLALRSLATQNRCVRLRVDGSVLAGSSKFIPRPYFAGRVSRYAELELGPADLAWGGVCDLTVRGGVGLPGLHQLDISSTESLLIPEELKDVSSVVPLASH